MSKSETTPVFMDRVHRHTGPVPLDYERGEFWMHGMNHDGARVSAPHLRQRDGEDLKSFIGRVRTVEAAIPGWEFPYA